MCVAMCISTHVIKPRFYIKSPHPNAHEGVIKFQISITYIRSMLYLKAYSTGLASLSLCTISTLCLPRAGSLLIYYVNSVLTCTWNYWPSPLSLHIHCLFAYMVPDDGGWPPSDTAGLASRLPKKTRRLCATPWKPVLWGSPPFCCSSLFEKYHVIAQMLGVFWRLLHFYSVSF